MPQPMSPYLAMTDIPPNRVVPLEDPFAAFGASTFVGPPRTAMMMGPPQLTPTPDPRIDSGSPGSTPAPRPKGQTRSPSPASSAPGWEAGYADMLAKIKEAGDAMANEQRGIAGQFRDQAKPLMAGDLQYDLSPLAALVDSWTGSNLQRGYKAPETGRERQERIQALQKNAAAADLQGRATDLEALKDLASGTFGLEKYKSDNSYRKERDKVGDALNREKLDQGWAELGIKSAKAAAPKEYKENQWKAALFGHRMLDANKNMEATFANPGVVERITSVQGGISRNSPGWTQDPLTKQIGQAERNFINAVLRRESGASISDPEYENAELQYFPRTGDDKKTLQWKAQNRARAIEGMRLEATGAWDQFSETPGGGSSPTSSPTITPEQARAELARRRSQ